MKANELRVGNWVNRRVISKCGVELMLHNVTTGDISVATFDFDPIPLTPELLMELNIYPFWIKDNNDIWLDENIQIPSCKHLHQLQNLYFALTGEELEYDPTMSETMKFLRSK